MGEHERARARKQHVAGAQRFGARAAPRPRQIDALAAAQVEAPLMPRTGDRRAAQRALEQWAPEVRTERLRAEDLAADAIERLDAPGRLHQARALGIDRARLEAGVERGPGGGGLRGHSVG